METIGWIGSIMFAMCALPQAIKSVRDGHSDGLSWGFLMMWLIGEVFTLIYVAPKGHIPLIANYAGNLVLLQIMIYYKIWRRK